MPPAKEKQAAVMAKAREARAEKKAALALRQQKMISGMNSKQQSHEFRS